MRTMTPKNALTIPPQATRVFAGVLFDVYQWQQKMFDGTEATFERLKRPDTVRIIAVKNKEIVVLEQEQPDRPLFYDIPGGRHDNESETELQAAQRELREETGMNFATWKLLKVEQPIGKIDWLVYTFLATDFIDEVTPKLDNGEKIKVTALPFIEAKQLLGLGEARHLPLALAQSQSLEELLAQPEYHN